MARKGERVGHLLQHGPGLLGSRLERHPPLPLGNAPSHRRLLPAGAGDPFAPNGPKQRVDHELHLRRHQMARPDRVLDAPKLLLSQLAVQALPQIRGGADGGEGCGRLRAEGLRQEQEAPSDVRPYGGPGRGEEHWLGRPRLDGRIDPPGSKRLADVLPNGAEDRSLVDRLAIPRRARTHVARGSMDPVGHPERIAGSEPLPGARPGHVRGCV